jgi:hypothetical protein
MRELILIIFPIVAFIAVRTYLRLRKEKLLRQNYPQRKVIELTLPPGTDQSRFMNASFWAKVASATTSDPKSRSQGVGQIDFKYIASVAAPRAMPQVRCFIYSDPERTEAIKKALKTVYEDISIVELNYDPLAEHIEAYRQREAGQEQEAID